MNATDLLERLRSQVASEMSQDRVLDADSWQDAVDEKINQMSNVDLVLRLEIVLTEIVK